MSWSNLPTDPRARLVADTSVIINLNATERAADIVAALDRRVVVPDPVRSELDAGRQNGHADAEALDTLIQSGHVQMASLGPTGYSVYERLIDGRTERTLDDGEAATIGCAVEFSGVALIDERKALSLCATLYPELPVVSTAALLLSDLVASALGQVGQADAVFAALRRARMRVPLDLVQPVIGLIGKERAQTCTCLPKARVRESASAR